MALSKSKSEADKLLLPRLQVTSKVKKKKMFFKSPKSRVYT